MASTSRSVTVIHENLPGRTRLRAAALYRDIGACERVEHELTQVPGVRRASASSLTSSVLIEYDSRRWSTPRLRALLSRIVKQATHPGGSPRARASAVAPLRGRPWHELGASRAARLLRSDPRAGLTRLEARKRTREFGANRLPSIGRRSQWELFAHQFASLPIYLLAGSATVSLLTGGIPDAIVIFSVVLVNGYLGYATESSAEKTIYSLTREKRKKITVIRDGAAARVWASELVPGDVILLQPGTTVPADARILEASHLTVDESTLTGESFPVSKSARTAPRGYRGIGDHPNLVFRGTQVTGGSARALVFGTGPSTEIGKIQRLMGESAQPETPLQKQLRHLGNQMALYSGLVSSAVLLVGLARGYRLASLLRVSISLAIAAIPESLPTIATTTLAQGIRALEHEGVLVRHLDALETLGGVDLLCLDKTGTITLNEMSVVAVSTLRGRIEVKEGALEPQRFPLVSQMARIAALCNEADLASGRGSPTEVALLKFAQQAEVDIDELRSTHRLASTSYRSESRNYMSTIHLLADGSTLVATKGRPAEVLELCSRVMEDGLRPLTPALREELRRENEMLASKGLRVLGIAFGERADAESRRDLIWLGLVAMADPIRPGTREWIAAVHAAGIRTVMITGDQRATARTIGETLRLAGSEPLSVLSASEIDSLAPRALARRVATAHVFARVSPAHKLKIVRALRRGRAPRTVAMVGDGINDGPALRVADVGIAMGARGAEAASQVADIVLQHDDLAQLTAALREGRRIQDDIKKAVDYILTQNFAEMLFTLASVALGLDEPLTPMQLLWINLVTDIFPELALAREPAEPGLLRRNPSHARDRLLQRGDYATMTRDSSLLTLATLGSYAYGLRRHGPGARAKTMGFLTLISSSLLYTLSARSRVSTLFDRERLPENRMIPAAIGAGFAAEGLAAFLPFFRALLGTGRVSAGDLMVSGSASVAPVVLIEIAKLLRRARNEAAAA